MKPLFKHNQSKQVENWRLMTASARRDRLATACETLITLLPDSQHGNAKRVFAQLLTQANKLDAVTDMDGATGESNELRHTARGKALIVGLPSAHGSSYASLLLMAQAVSALLAGCEVILRCVEQQNLTANLQEAFLTAGVPDLVIDVANDADLVTLLHMSRLAVVGVVGIQKEVNEVANTLAQTDGILTQLVPITDLEGGHEIFAPDFVFHYSTERVKTVNTTAIGGNASLIELGMG